MAVEASGTQTATVSTEHTLHTNTTAGKKLVLYVDTVNMADGTTPDILELRIKRKVLTGDTIRIVYSTQYIGKQGDASNGTTIKQSIPINNEFSAEFTLKQTQGTGRNYTWSVESV
jgi:hypothetical protein